MKNCKVIAKVDVPKGGSAFIRKNGDVYARGPAKKVGHVRRPKGKMVFVRGTSVIAGEPAGRSRCGKVSGGKKGGRKVAKAKGKKGAQRVSHACPRTPKQIAATKRMLQARWPGRRTTHVGDRSHGFCDTYPKKGKKGKKAAASKAKGKKTRKGGAVRTTRIKKGSAAWKKHERAFARKAQGKRLAEYNAMMRRRRLELGEGAHGPLAPWEMQRLPTRKSMRRHKKSKRPAMISGPRPGMLTPARRGWFS